MCQIWEPSNMLSILSLKAKDGRKFSSVSSRAVREVSKNGTIYLTIFALTRRKNRLSALSSDAASPLHKRAIWTSTWGFTEINVTSSAHTASFYSQKQNWCCTIKIIMVVERPTQTPKILRTENLTLILKLSNLRKVKDFVRKIYHLIM